MLRKNISKLTSKSKIKKRGALRYSSKDYSNPFFKNKKKTSTNSINKKNKTSSYGKIRVFKFLVLFLFILIIFGFWFLLYSKYFKIKHILIKGEDSVNVEEIQSQIWSKINNKFFVLAPRKNIFLFNLGELGDEFKNKYHLDKLEVSKKYPNNIEIYIKEKIHSLVWYENDVYYFADLKGDLIKEINPTEININHFPIIDNISNNRKENNRITVDIRYVNNIVKLFEKFKNFNEYQIEKFIVDNNKSIIKLQLIDGPKVYFNQDLDVDMQIQKLQTIKKNKLKDTFNDKEYIDLTVGNTVYYR